MYYVPQEMVVLRFRDWAPYHLGHSCDKSYICAKGQHRFLRAPQPGCPAIQGYGDMVFICIVLIGYHRVNH